MGQHRKHGMKGGRGAAGGHKYKWSYVVKYEPNYFGRHGFTPRGRPIPPDVRAINIGDLDLLLEKFIDEKKIQERDGKFHADLDALGFDKLLGRGRVTRPLFVKTKLFTQNAAKKLEEAGGRLLTQNSS